MKKITTTILALAMILSLSVSAFAAAPSAATQTTPGITTSGGTDTTEVQLVIGTGDGTSDSGSGSGAFSVTVPTVLPFAVANDGTVSVASNAKIINGSNGPVKVTSVTATGANGWAIVANGTNFKTVPMNTKSFTLTLNGDNFPAAATNTASALSLTGASWPSIAGDNGELALIYSGAFASQTSNLNVKVADVVFTVAWDAA